MSPRPIHAASGAAFQMSSATAHERSGISSRSIRNRLHTDVAVDRAILAVPHGRARGHVPSVTQTAIETS